MISETISKKVISITDGKCVGTVKDVKFASGLTKVLGYVVFNDDDDVDMFLDACDVYKESMDVVMIKNQNVLVFNDSFDGSLNPICKDVFDVNGEFLGKVRDVDVRGTRVIRIILQRVEILQKDILFSGNNVIIRAEKEKRANFTLRKKKINNVGAKEDLPVTYAMDISREKKQEAPPRYTTDMKLFVGRRATATVLGYNNELIVRENEFITDGVIKNAKKHNRIPQLIFNSI